MNVLANALAAGPGLPPPEAKRISQAIETSAKNSYLRSENLQALPALPGTPETQIIRGTVIHIGHAVCDAVNRIVRDKTEDLKSGNPYRINRAKIAIALAGSVAGGVTVSARKTGNRAIMAKAKRIGLEVGIAAASHGKAAAIQVIRNNLTRISDAEALAGRSRLDIEKWTRVLAEGVGIGFSVQKGESAAGEVREKAKDQAVHKMMTEAKVSAPVAEEIARRLSTRETVTEANVKDEIERATRFANRMANNIFDEVTTERKGDALDRLNLTNNEYRSVAGYLIKEYYGSGLNNPLKPRTEVIAGYLRQAMEKINQSLPVGQRVLLDDAKIQAAAQQILVRIEGQEQNFRSQEDILHRGRLDQNQPAHLPLPQIEDREKIARAAVSGFNVSGEAAEASTKAAALEAGLSETVAQNAGAKAKGSIGKGKTVAASETMVELPVSDDLAGAAAISVLLSNGHGDAVDSAQANGASVRDNLILVHSHDRMEGAANVGSAALQAIKEANVQLAADVIPVVLADDVASIYQEHGSITFDQFVAKVANRIAFPTPDERNALVLVWGKIESSLKIEEGLEVGKEAKALPGVKSPEMAEAIASVATGLGLGKAVTMEIARQLSNHYGDQKPQSITDEKARSLIRDSVSLVNARAHDIRQKAYLQAQIAPPDGLNFSPAEAKAFRHAIRIRYLKSGRLTEDDVTSLAHQHGPAGLDADKVKALYNQLKDAEKGAVANPAHPTYVSLSLTRENTIAKMAVVFSDKSDPTAAGSSVASAALRVSKNTSKSQKTALILASLAAIAAGKHDGGKADPASVADAVGVARLGLRAATAHIKKVGYSAAVAAAAGNRLTDANFAALDFVRAGQLGDIAYQGFVDAGGTDGLHFGANNGVVYLRGAMSRVVRQAALTARGVVANPLGNPPVQASTKESVAKAAGIAGSTFAAIIRACKKNVTEEIQNAAEGVAIAVSGPALIAQGPVAVELELKKRIALNEHLRKLPESDVRTICDSAVSGMRIAEGSQYAAENPQAGDPLPDWVASTAEKLAKKAGATDEEAKAVGLEAKAALGSVNAPLTADLAVQISVLAAAPLVKADPADLGWRDTARAFSASLAFALDTGDAASKARSAKSAAGLSQVTDSERQLSAQPKDLDESAKKNKVGALPAEDLMAAKLQEMRKARAAVDKADDKILAEAKTESFDHSLHVKGGSNMSKPETWTLTMDGGEMGPQTKTLKEWAEKDEGFKKCLADLTACCVDGKNYATSDTFVKALEAYNHAHTWSKVTATVADNSRGGVDITFKGGVNLGVMKEILTAWAEQSQKEIPKTIDVREVSRSPVFGPGN